MGLDSGMGITDRFATYVGELTKAVGHADRVGPVRDYCAGLLATEGRRNAEMMAVVTKPAHVSAQHQKLLHVVANSTWSDEPMPSARPDCLRRNESVTDVTNNHRPTLKQREP